MHPYIGFIAYHIPNIYDFSKFPVHNPTGKIKICQASTNILKKNTVEVAEILQKLETEFDIEPVIITGKSWTETLKIKAQCHITVDQFIYGALAGSAIESMYLGHPVVGRISEFVRSMHPDVPLVHSDLDSLYSVLSELIQDPNRIEQLGREGHEYAVREHSAELNVIKWNYLIDWVKNGFH